MVLADTTLRPKKYPKDGISVENIAKATIHIQTDWLTLKELDKAIVGNKLKRETPKIILKNKTEDSILVKVLFVSFDEKII